MKALGIREDTGNVGRMGKKMETRYYNMDILGYNVNRVFRILIRILEKDMGGCQNHGPFLDPYSNKRDTTTHMSKGKATKACNSQQE